MILNRRASSFLLAFAVWSWIIWPMFLRNIWADDRSWAPAGGPTGFFVVHALLTAASLVFGALIGLLGWRGLVAARRAGNDPAGDGTGGDIANARGRD